MYALGRMQVTRDTPLAPLTTFGVGGSARFFARCTTADDVAAAVRWAGEQGVALFVLGGGSNLLVPDVGFDGLVLQVAILGIERDGSTFRVGAGVPWESVVDAAIAADCAGIECLAGIPGSTGGTPVQNVGAYGQEVAETIQSVQAFDRRCGEIVSLDAAACHFRYRESLFNTDEPGRYIVTEVSFALRAGGAPRLAYADLRTCFPDTATPSLREIADAVRKIRSSKGMLVVDGDPDTRSAGSFFKNPIVPESDLDAVAAAIGAQPAEVPHWNVGDGRMKLPAAWLLERAGFVKGFGDGPVRISSRHTLALTNRGDATFADVLAFQQQIVAAVQAKFGIRLEREPVILR